MQLTSQIDYNIVANDWSETASFAIYSEDNQIKNYFWLSSVINSQLMK